jgi:hypothetical protein
VSTWRYQILDAATREPLGTPFRCLIRCLARLRFENLCAGENRYTLRPIRSYEAYLS